MKKKMKALFQSAGHYMLALLCAAVILLSALWTRTAPAPDASPAQMNQSQRLEDLTPSPAPLFFQRPVAGQIIRPFSTEPVFFDTYHLLRFHPSTDLETAPEEQIMAAFDGRIRWEGNALYLENDAFSLRYRGVLPGHVQTGRQVKKGAVLGIAAGFVPYEGENILCLTLYRDGEAVDIAAYFPE